MIEYPYVIFETSQGICEFEGLQSISSTPYDTPHYFIGCFENILQHIPSPFPYGFVLPKKYNIRKDLWKPRTKKKHQKQIACNPEKQAWIHHIKLLQSKFSKTLAKVVLARITELEHDQTPLDIFLSLPKSAGYRFLIQSDKDTSFIGATPERLYSSNSHSVAVDLIAGTVKKSDFASTKMAREHILSNSKLLDEFSFLEKNIRDLFKQYNYSISALSTIETNTLTHLFKIATIPNANLKHEQLINMLHPTPAVCGSNTREAYNYIQNNEMFSRELYAAPAGVITNCFSEIFVLLRSALIKKNRLLAFSGAGITAMSEPEEEWEELSSKIGLFTHE